MEDRKLALVRQIKIFMKDNLENIQLILDQLMLS